MCVCVCPWQWKIGESRNIFSSSLRFGGGNVPWRKKFGESLLFLQEIEGNLKKSVGIFAHEHEHVHHNIMIMTRSRIGRWWSWSSSWNTRGLRLFFYYYSSVLLGLLYLVVIWKACNIFFGRKYQVPFHFHLLGLLLNVIFFKRMSKKKLGFIIVRRASKKKRTKVAYNNKKGKGVPI